MSNLFGLEENIGECESDPGDSSDASASDEDSVSWISWFCSLKGNEFFCEVEEDFINDDFNLCGLSAQVPYYDYALDLILDADSPAEVLTEGQHELVESAAEKLYGLIHVRYILTAHGMGAMFDKYKNIEFGRCPRTLCNGQPCLPVGIVDVPKEGTVKIFCPKCKDIYNPKNKYQATVDGMYFGTTFPHLLLMTYPSLRPAQPTGGYIARVFGFKLHHTAEAVIAAAAEAAARAKEAAAEKCVSALGAGASAAAATQAAMDKTVSARRN